MPEPDAAFRRLLEVLDRLRIPFYVAGSVASSNYGVIRATNDVDLIGRIEPRTSYRWWQNWEKSSMPTPI
jgi:hypothetical protein